MDQVPLSMSGQGTVPSSLSETTTSMLRFYNSDDPATYPTYQGSSPPPTYNPNPSPSSSSSRNICTVAAAPNSEGQGVGYNGLPLVRNRRSSSLAGIPLLSLSLFFWTAFFWR